MVFQLDKKLYVFIQWILWDVLFDFMCLLGCLMMFIYIYLFVDLLDVLGRLVSLFVC